MQSLTIRKIREAFPAHPVIPIEQAVAVTYGVEHLYEIMVGKAWNELSEDQYRRCSDGTSLLSDQGLLYYLPGYMTASITNTEAADVVPSYLVWGLRFGSSEFTDARTRFVFGSFNTGQMEAFVLWLGWYTLRFGYSLDVHRCYEAVERTTGPDLGLGFPELRLGNLVD
jgi:hypothetical protein